MKIRNSLKSLKSRHRDCRVIRRRGRTYVITAQRRSGYGPWYRSPPYAMLKRSASDAELGAAVVRAIESCEYVVVAPTVAEIDGWNSELYGVVRVKDERTFERGASLVLIVLVLLLNLVARIIGKIYAVPTK